MSTPLLPFSESVVPLTMLVCRYVSLGWIPEELQSAFEDFPREESYKNRSGVAGFADAWERVSGNTYVDIFRLMNLARILEECLEQPGDVIECGTAAGGSALLMALLIRERNLDKKVWLFDSFEGLPAPDRSVDRSEIYQRGMFSHSLEQVSALMARHGVKEVCEFRKGWFSETLPRLSSEQTFCFGHIDADLYGSTRDCIPQLWDRLSAGGALVFDDYTDGSGGVFQAVNEEANDRGLAVEIGPSCQGSLHKRTDGKASCALCYKPAEGASMTIAASIEALRRFEPYLEFLEAGCRGLRSASFQKAWHVRPIGDATREEIGGSIEAYLRMCREAVPEGVFPIDQGGDLVFTAAAERP